MKRDYKVVHMCMKDYPLTDFEQEVATLTAGGYRMESSGFNDGAVWAILSKPVRMRTTAVYSLKEPEMEAIRAMADADMNLSRAARDLGLHRDTLRSQLETIANRTGLSPTNFYDLSELLYPEEV